MIKQQLDECGDDFDAMWGVLSHAHRFPISIQLKDGNYFSAPRTMRWSYVHKDYKDWYILTPNPMRSSLRERYTTLFSLDYEDVETITVHLAKHDTWQWKRG